MGMFHICRMSENCTYLSKFKSDIQVQRDGLVLSVPFPLFFFCSVHFCRDQSASNDFPALWLFAGVKCAIVEKSETFSSHPQAHFINNRTMEVNFLPVG